MLMITNKMLMLMLMLTMMMRSVMSGEMGKTIAENLFYTFNFPQIFLQDLFSVIEKEF